MRLSALGSLLTMGIAMCSAMSGAQNDSSGTPHVVPVQRSVSPKRRQQVGPVPNPDPNGSTVRQQYPQQPGYPPVTDACFIAVSPTPAGCMYTPYVFYAGTNCECIDPAGNVYLGRFLLY